MNSKIKSTIRTWLETETLPDIDQVKKLRKAVLVEPGEEALAKKLIQVESNLKKDLEDPLAPLEEIQHKEVQSKTRLALQMADREPFVESRRRLLKRVARTVDATILHEAGKTIELEVVGTYAEQRILALYHWESLD